MCRNYRGFYECWRAWEGPHFVARKSLALPEPWPFWLFGLIKGISVPVSQYGQCKDGPTWPVQAAQLVAACPAQWNENGLFYFVRFTYFLMFIVPFLVSAHQHPNVCTGGFKAPPDLPDQQSLSLSLSALQHSSIYNWRTALVTWETHI